MFRGPLCPPKRPHCDVSIGGVECCAETDMLGSWHSDFGEAFTAQVSFCMVNDLDVLDGIGVCELLNCLIVDLLHDLDLCQSILLLVQRTKRPNHSYSEADTLQCTE